MSGSSRALFRILRAITVNIKRVVITLMYTKRQSRNELREVGLSVLGACVTSV